jgi:hypothetical protein
MKRQLCTLLTIATLNAALIANASAMSSTADTHKDTLIAQLDRQTHRLDWAAQSTKGSALALREQQSLRVKKLIQRLQAGDAVDPQEIDKLLKEQPWPQ